MGTVWVARDMVKGGMQYAVFTSRPERCKLGFQSTSRGCIRTDVRNDIGVAMCGRPLEIQECIEVVCTEVVG
jgi:hypothetical protein